MDSLKDSQNIALDSRQSPTKLPLHNVLLANGFLLDKSKSSKANPVLVAPSGIKFVISLVKSGDYLYFNPQEQGDKGNIYNFCKNHNLDLGDLIETYEKNKDSFTIQIAQRGRDSRAKSEVSIMDYFNTLPQYDSHKHYYLHNRALDSNTISAFSQNIKVDSHFNTIFPQYEVGKMFENYQSFPFDKGF